jgi:hypothetical protein
MSRTYAMTFLLIFSSAIYSDRPFKRFNLLALHVITEFHNVHECSQPLAVPDEQSEENHVNLWLESWKLQVAGLGVSKFQVTTKSMGRTPSWEAVSRKNYWVFGLCPSSGF